MGYTPYPGTMNLAMSEKVLFGGQKIYAFNCVPADIEGIAGHFCIKTSSVPQRTGFLVAPVCLRETLDVKNGDTVRVVIK